MNSEFGILISNFGFPAQERQTLRYKGALQKRAVSDDLGELSAFCEEGVGAQRSSEGALFGRALRAERF